MLQVGVHHRRIGRAGGENPLDAGPRQAAPPDAADTANAGVGVRDLAHGSPGAIGRIVVNEHHFPGDARERSLELAVELGDIVALIERRNDDRKRRQTHGLLRILGFWPDRFVHAQAYIRRPLACQGPCKGGSSGTGAERVLKAVKQGPKMPTTTNNRRAYIRRSHVINVVVSSNGAWGQARRCR